MLMHCTATITDFTDTPTVTDLAYQCYRHTYCVYSTLQIDLQLQYLTCSHYCIYICIVLVTLSCLSYLHCSLILSSGYLLLDYRPIALLLPVRTCSNGRFSPFQSSALQVARRSCLRESLSKTSDCQTHLLLLSS